MTPRKCERALRAKLAAQGVDEDTKRSTASSFFFILKARNKGFTIPKPPEPFGWTAQQQDAIATTLEYLGLELWPLDYNL